MDFYEIEIPESTYIHKNELNQYIYVQVPMDLIVESCFAKISGDAKLLYGLLLNRTGLSIRNGWEDGNGRTYINYTVEDVMKDLHISHGKASKLFSELANLIPIRNKDGKKDWFGLIEKVRILNKPSRIYVRKVSEVKKIMDAVCYSDNSLQSCVGLHTEQNTSENTPEPAKMQVVHDRGRRSSTNMDDGHPQSWTTAIQKCGRRSSMIVDENKNYLENNNGSKNNQFHSRPEEQSRQDERMEEIDLLRQMIRENVDYDFFVMDRQHYNCRQIDELIEIMVEACVWNEEVIIGGKTIPHELIRNRFQKYDRDMMQYVLLCLKNNTTEVHNTKKYLLAVLYNAPTTMNLHYSLMAQHDMNCRIEENLEEGVIGK